MVFVLDIFSNLKTPIYFRLLWLLVLFLYNYGYIVVTDNILYKVAAMMNFYYELSDHRLCTITLNCC